MKITVQPARREVRVFRASDPEDIGEVVAKAEVLGWEPIGGPYVVPWTWSNGFGFAFPIGQDPNSGSAGIVYHEVHILMRREVFKESEL